LRLYSKATKEIKLDQPDPHIAEFEGRSVTLQCKYKTTSPQPELFWYIQKENHFPKYMLKRNKYGGEDNDAQFQERFDSNVSSDSVPLTIKNLHVSDSAVYYCVLQPTHCMYMTNLHIFTLCFGDEITPESTEESAAVGSNVTLSCSYSSAQSLQWYRQSPGSAPQFLVLIIEGVKETETSDVDPRFSTKLRKKTQSTKEIKRVDLMISSAAVSDSALYYCALRPTVTGNTRTLYKNLTQMMVYNQFVSINLLVIYCT
uniref:Ig-like domain-containing protein n=1 Tax=Cyprinus carpio TaxID=7962 RepID=A0A8C1LW37_CYPCA